MKYHLALIASLALATASAETVWLDSLNLSAATQGWGQPQKNKSVDGNPLALGGKTFERGFGTHAESVLKINLNGGAQRFSAIVGVDDETKNPAASVEFIVRADGKILWQSGVMKAGDAPKSCDVSLAKVKSLVLEVGDAGDGINYDHADWADARIEISGSKKPATVAAAAAPGVAPYILTPPAPARPRINGASVFGVRPGSPFLYTIPATGERPMQFSAANLPKGLTLDAGSGRITGALENKGEFIVTLGAKNARGLAEKKFRIVCGDQIALTPPMGWNSWNCFAHAVSADKVKIAADAMIKSGLVNHGWTYINIDDFWENHQNSKDATLRGPFRDAQGNIVPNVRFPDMKGLADYVHGLGLKIGLYSSPGPWTCGGCAASWQHEKIDAETYARWGFDYLKYDWCSYGSIAANSTLGELKKPYILMGELLRQQPRDIVYSLCQYGMGKVWEWGAEVGGNCWRTTGDITDTWSSLAAIGFSQDPAAPFTGPGHWADPDMLIVGQVGWGNLHPTRLTPDEQYTHISLWCLLSAPLLIGCDMEKLDEFTLNLLSNDEVLALDQDELGKQATCVIKDGGLRVYEKELADGGRGVGFFNLGATPVKLKFTDFSKLNLSGKQTARDLWRQRNVGTVNTAKDSLPLAIPAHGVLLYKFTRAR